MKTNSFLKTSFLSLCLTAFIGILLFTNCDQDDLMELPPQPYVTIGNQDWMVKNLDVSVYRNGDPIPKVTDDVEWNSLTTGAYCYYNNDSVTYAATYGKLYNWYAVNDPRGLGPAGWHVASDADWTILSDYLGGLLLAGGKMKEKGTAYWNVPNTGATNISGFTGLPGGIRGANGKFVSNGDVAFWWSSTESNSPNAWDRELFYNDEQLNRFVCDEIFGFSVRCLRD